MSTTAIMVRNAQRKLSLDVAGLQRFAEAALQECRRRFPERTGVLREIAEISAAVISDRRIAALHRRFMAIGGPTDVITFHHGDIFISIETAARQAQEFGTSTEDELRLYIVHGILHLLGFADTTPAAARVMQATQEKIVAAICV